MSLPDDIGPMSQLFGMQADKVSNLGWHEFSVKSPRGGEAGRWCNDHIAGKWTFRSHPGQTIFYIREDQDAMLFKLTWGGL